MVVARLRGSQCSVCDFETRMHATLHRAAPLQQPEDLGNRRIVKVGKEL